MNWHVYTWNPCPMIGHIHVWILGTAHYFGPSSLMFREGNCLYAGGFAIKRKFHKRLSKKVPRWWNTVSCKALQAPQLELVNQIKNALALISSSPHRVAAPTPSVRRQRSTWGIAICLRYPPVHLSPPKQTGQRKNLLRTHWMVRHLVNLWVS